MTNVYPLTACDLIVGARTAPPKRRQRKPTLTAALKAARKAGADHVEIVDGRIVIALAGEKATPTGTGTAAPDTVANEWDDLLPGGGHGAH
jgi:hypothetical protein